MKYPKDYWKFFEDNFNQIYFLDLETNGLNPWQDEFITLSLSVCDLKSGDLIDEIDLNFRPSNDRWSEEAESVHRITKKTAMAFPERHESRKQLLSFLSYYQAKTPQIFCCHALNFKGQGYFDWNFFFAEFFRHDQHWELYKNFHDVQSSIDYAKEASSKGLISVQNNKLNTIAEYFKIPLDHHNAKSDREACQKIYFKLRNL